MMKMKRIFFRSFCLVFIISLFICIPVMTEARTSGPDQSSFSSSITCSIVSQADNQTMTITPDSPLKDGDAKAQYLQELQVHNGSGSYTWALEKGSKLPSGLNLKADKSDSSIAILSGKPAKPVDNCSFTVKVTDKITGIPAVMPYQLHINPAVTLSVPKVPSLEDGQIIFEWIPTASGGDENFTWSIIKGQLPDGLELNSSTGKISGSPSKSGNFKATLEVKDSIGGSASKALSFNVLKKLEILTLSLPSADIGVAYKSPALKAEGGKKPYTWIISGGTGANESLILEGYNPLPPGFTLSDKGVITGTAQKGSSGTYTFPVGVEDSIALHEHEFSLTINEPLEIIASIPANGYLGDTCSFALNAGGGSGSGYKWALSGKVPTGLKLTSTKSGESTTYAVAGTLKKQGIYNFTFKLTDSLKGSVTQDVTFQVFGERPKVTSVTPADNATGVSVNTQIKAVFSQTMDYSTFTTNSFTLKAGVFLIPAAVFYDNGTKTATLTPASNLSNSAVYTACLTLDIKNLEGNCMASLKTWSFTTEADLVSPQVVSVTPSDQAEEVDFDAVIRVEFSEALDPSTLSASSFTLKRDGKIVTGTVTPDSDNKAALFYPSNRLLSNTLYTAEITTQVTDAAGNPLATSFTWSFTTRISQIAVSLLSPSSVAVNQQFTVEVQINNVTDLHACQFQINFNSSVVQMVDSVLYPDGMENGQIGPAVFEPSWYLPDTGSIRWGCELPSNVIANGSGYLLKLHFKALKAGQSAFIFTDVEGIPGQEDFYNKLFDSLGFVIPFERINGQITITSH
jgi:hypothetical protein